jgi:hypothetical protein
MEKKYLTDDERAARVQNIRRLATEITELAGHLNAANYRFLKLIADFDREEGWVDNATHSCAHWLNWKCGIALGAAREKVRTAHALENLPKVAAAMERGELSYSKARAITRVACAKTEDYFLSLGLRGTAHHVETIVRQYRRCVEADDLSKEARQQINRSVNCYWDDDGSLVLKARMPAEAGALLLKALDAATEDCPSPKRKTRRHTAREFFPDPCPIDEPSFEARRADALGLMAESFMKHGAASVSGGDRHQIVVHVSAETLQHGMPGQCEIQDGPGVAMETVRRLACDASVVAIVEDENGEPLSVGRKTRSIPPALRRALNARDKGCRFPGCTHRRYVDAHHIQHWAHGGETKASNLVTLCRFHHRKVHEGAVIVQVLDDGALRFVRPNGESYDSVGPNYTQPLGDWSRLPAVHREREIRIDADTAVVRWDGNPCDYGLAIEVLMLQAGKSNVTRAPKDVSAETSRVQSALPPLDDGGDFAREVMARNRARNAANGEDCI